MSGNDGWANQIGTTAYATTPSGSIPQYSLGLDAGTAPWTDQQTFKTFVEDSALRNRPEVKAVEAKKEQDDTGWFQKALGYVGEAATFTGRTLAQGVGFIAGGPTQDYDPAQDIEQGKSVLDAGGWFSEGVAPALHTAYRGLATPFIASQQAYKTDGWWLTDPSDWSQAWQLAEERSPGQAFVDWVLQGEDPTKSQKNLDRLKRTSSLYGITSLAADFAIGWRLDPTVVGAKGLGEARRIRAGEMPRQVERPNLIPGQPKRAGTAYPNAVRGFLGEERLGNTPGAHYGYWRGQRIAGNLPALREAAQTMSPADFANMPMFRRRNANNGAAAAELFQIASKDDALWDLTARAMMPDPKAWAEIQLMKEGVNPLIPDDELRAAIARGERPADQRSYLDALEAQKSKFEKLDKEVQDLEKVLATRTPGKGGFYEYYTKELHATYESRVADLTDLETRLGQYYDHKSWLDGVTSIDNPGAQLNVVKVKPASFDYLSQRTYQKNLWGPVHTVHEITKAGWLKAANPIELHRVDSGARAIRAQFEQMQHLLDYRAEPGVIDGTLSEFTRRVMAGNNQGAAMLVRDLEANHLVAGLSQRHGLSPEVVTDWMNALRAKQGDMVGKLLSGDGAIYTTAPGQGAKIVRKLEDSYVIEVTEGARRHTIKVPTAAFEGMRDTANLAQDVVQTPNYYTPLSVRQLHLAIKRDPELFKELESGYRNFGREWVGKTMNTIDSLGGKWNRFWKPLQLFRLAWPQRVLMDEGLRGMAMLGISSWMNNYGAAFYNASVNAFNPYHHPVFGPTLAGAAAGTLAGGPLGGALGAMAAGTAGSILKRRSLRIGPGPIADDLTGRSGVTEVHIPEDAPTVPSYFAPKRSAKRADALGQMAPELRMLRRENIRRAALYRAHKERTAGIMATLREGGKVDRNTIPHIPATPKHIAIDPDANDISALGYNFPIHRTLRSFTAGHNLPGAPDRLVVDPITGKKVSGGFAIPVSSKELRPNPGELNAGPSEYSSGLQYGREEHDLGDFLMNNQDFLSSQGYRVMFERAADGHRVTAHVVRIFRASERDKAISYAQHVEADRFINMVKDHPEFIRDWNAKSPIMETLDRRFANTDEPQYVPGSMPTNEGNVNVHHGATSPLPVGDDGYAALKAKDDPSLPVANGRMIGDGFYTSTDIDEVRAAYARNGFSWDNEGEIYTIRGTRSGQPHTVFNLDKQITPAERNKLLAAADEWANEQRAMIQGKLGAFDQHGIWHQDDVDYWLNNFEGEYTAFRTRIEHGFSGQGGASTWVELMAGSSEFYHASGSIFPRRFITKYIEDNYNAKALKHLGGTRGSATGRQHHVYVWLDPEDLQVKPAYEKGDNWYNLEEWFDNPMSLEDLFDAKPEEFATARFHPVTGEPLKNPPGQPRQLKNEVPENRIHRVGPKPREQARQAVGDLRAQEVGVEDAFNDLDFNIHIDSVHERFIRKLQKRKQLGRGNVKFTAADGSKIIAPAAYDGPGEIYEALVSGAPAFARLTDSYRRTLSMAQHKAVGYKRILPPDLSPGILKTKGGQQQAAEYYTAWADLLNDQVRNSPIWFKMLEGKTDEQIVTWLERSSEGARLRKTLPHKGYDPERWVEEHRQALDFYLPRTDLQALLREQRINPSELRRISREDMPEVYGPDLEMIEGSSPLGNWWGRQVERIYTALGTTPTDKLSRQPFFKGMYDLRMANLMRSVDPLDITDELLQQFSKQSREFALRQVKRTMYELGDDTNMTEALRFLAPFWGAQQEALMKWMSIAIERPEMVARFYMGMNAAYDRLTIIDEDGKPVEGPDGEWKGFGYNPNHRINFQVPKALRNAEPFKTLLAGQENIRTSFGSLNTALQGDKPFLPGLGPVLSVPADTFINAMWDTHGTEFDDNFFYRWLFPVGRPASGVEGKLDYIMPGWGRRLQQLRKGMDARTYANTWYSVQREMMLDAERKGVRPPTNEEINDAVKWHFALRTVASFAGPVALQFAPKHQFYLDQYHALQQQFGPAMAFEEFVKKYGADAARFAASSSTSVGVPPTALGMKEWKSNDKLIQQLHETGQDDLISAVISPDAWADDFSSDAYSAQFDIKLGPGTRDTLRETVNPAERTRIVDARLGWIEYRKLTSAINSELFARGLTTTQQTGAEDLAELKRFQVQQIASKYPAWNDQYNTFSNTIYSTVEALRGFVHDKRFDNRPDMQGARQYLIIRDQVAAELERYAAETGGSRSLQANENAALRQWFYTQVGQLVLDNPAFGEFYSRYLDSDSLERGAG